MTKKKAHETEAPPAHLRRDTSVPFLVQKVPEPNRLPASFFQTEAGSEPVREWLKALTKDDRVKIGTDIRAVELGWPIGMPLCKPLGRGLWEIRTTLQDRIARIIFCVHDQEMVLLHGFIKKNQKTPQADIAVAYDRKRKMVR
jgi:phage-related protein